jgi:hypothetical protein
MGLKILLFPAGVGPAGGGESNSVRPSAIAYRLPASRTTPPRSTKMVPRIDLESIWLSDGRENGNDIFGSESSTVNNFLSAINSRAKLHTAGAILSVAEGSNETILSEVVEKSK